MRRYSTHDAPPVRTKTAEHATLERDVEAFLARGGSITTYPAGASSAPEIASLRELVQDEFDVARARARVRRIRARARVRRIRSRGNARSVAAGRARREA